jgi:hypothetical protein
MAHDHHRFFNCQSVDDSGRPVRRGIVDNDNLTPGCHRCLHLFHDRSDRAALIETGK